MRLLMCFEKPLPCVLTEFMPGGDLHSHLRANGPPSSERAKQLALGIARGLAYLHENRVIHRDLKSPNILVPNALFHARTYARAGAAALIAWWWVVVLQLDGHGEPVLADFGHARWSARTMTIATHTVGTWQWLAPEMMEPGSQYGTTVDVYGLGIIVWELLSGQVLPFSG